MHVGSGVVVAVEPHGCVSGIPHEMSVAGGDSRSGGVRRLPASVNAVTRVRQAGQDVWLGSVAVRLVWQVNSAAKGPSGPRSQRFPDPADPPRRDPQPSRAGLLPELIERRGVTDQHGRGYLVEPGHEFRRRDRPLDQRRLRRDFDLKPVRQRERVTVQLLLGSKG